MINKGISIICTLALVSIMGSCKKETQNVNASSIPWVQVEELINLSLPAYFDLSIPGGWVYYPAGSRGLIIHRKNQSEFIAMDRHCPYQPEDGCTVEMDNSAVFSECPCCNSQFGVNDASILQGPAVENLRIYNTTFDGTFLRVFN